MENSKEIAKKLKILKKIIMASFQAKIGWKMLRKRENKNYRSISFLRCVIENSKKIIKKFEKYHYEFISSQNRMEKDGNKRK